MNAPSLLVIDQDTAVQHAVETALNGQGFEVSAVGDGLSALDIALATVPDIILADYRMAGMNVIRFFEKLKQKNTIKHIALLLLVNPSDVYDELTLRLVGVSDFIRKPLDPQELINRVKRYAPVPAHVPSATPTVRSPEAEGEPMKIEDLLGWPQPSAPSPFSELSQEQPAGFDLSLDPVAAEPATSDDTLFLDRAENTPTDFLSPSFEDHPSPSLEDSLNTLDPPETSAHAAPVSSTSFEEFAPPFRGTASGTADSASTPAPINGGAAPPKDLVERLTRDVVEKIAWEIVPGLAQQTLQQIVKTVVERVVWDTVPTIAEHAIKQEIERLKADKG